MKKNLSLLEKSVLSKETRLISRVLRSLGSIRRRLTVQALQEVINSQSYEGPLEQQKTFLLKHLQQLAIHFMEDTKGPSIPQQQASPTSPTAMEIETPTPKPTSTIPEVEVYLHLLLCIFLIDHKFYDQVRFF